MAARGAGYEQVEFDPYEPVGPVDAVVACNSVHHVKDPGELVGQIADGLDHGRALIVVEWARARFDEPTAKWCFDRLGPSKPAGWLHRRRDDWAASGQTWDAYPRAWGEEEGLHSARELIEVLNERFGCRTYQSRPRFFSELIETSDSDEQAGIDAGQIRATRIEYVATPR